MGFDFSPNYQNIGDCMIGCVRSLLQVQYIPYPQKIFASSQSGLSPFMFIGDPNVVPTPTSFHFHSASQFLWILVVR